MEDFKGQFLGTGWSFPPSFHGNGGHVELVSADEDIRQSLQILMSTSMGERIMFSDFGCDLQRFMFEELDQSLLNEIESQIETALINHEPRIELESVTIDTSDAINGKLLIQIHYLIRGTNTRHNMVYPFYLNEANN